MTNHKIEKSKSDIFARIRSNNYGESQSFTSVDAAITWVQQASRELVESGYANVTFTILGEYNSNINREHATDSQANNHIQVHNLYNTTNKKAKKMKEKSNILTTDFFMVSERDVKTIAAATMEAAIRCKELSDNEFEEAIMDVSNGLVSLRRSDNKIDFKYWEPYKKTHPSTDPCKKPLKAIEQTIMDTYLLGQSRIRARIESDANMSNASINNVLTSSCHNNKTVEELVQNITSTIHVHLIQDKNVRTYLSCHSIGVAAEISDMTGGVITCSMSDDTVTLSCSTGVTSLVTTTGKALNEIDRQLRTILIRLLIHASISHRTRDAIACIIDLESLADMALIEDLIADTASLSSPHKENNENVLASTSDTPLYSYSLL